MNATPLGMKPGDPLLFNINHMPPTTFVGEVVLKKEHTPLRRAARDTGYQLQIGTDMLFEIFPAYRAFFRFGTALPKELRGLARLRY